MMGDTIRLERVTFEELPPLETFSDHTVQQSREWVEFISKSQGAEPVFAQVLRDNAVVGRFTGLITKKFGLRILGSPFPGWTTSYMGFNLLPEIPRAKAVLALEEFAFSDLKCLHLELMDRNLSSRDVEDIGYHFRFESGFEVDLSRSEKDIFANMKSACRRAIRRAEKLSLSVAACDGKGFADDYYAQLNDVFAKQSLVPTYPKSRVEALIEHLMPTGRLLLVRATTADGECAGTSIFPAMNDTMYFWGGASWRAHQLTRPNEAMMWFAMRYWKSRGITRFDMGGGSEYKRKYGGADIAIPWIRKSKYPAVERLRNLARNAFDLSQRVKGAWRN